MIKVPAARRRRWSPIHLSATLLPLRIDDQERLAVALQVPFSHLVDSPLPPVRVVVWGRCGRKLDANAATSALRAVIAGSLRPRTTAALAMRAWEIRHVVDAYDALYVALAEQLGAPLVTCDARLAASNGHQADIELYPRG